jgi:integrase
MDVRYHRSADFGMTFRPPVTVTDLSKKRDVDAIQPEPVRRLVWDSRRGRTGFGLDVWPSGTKSYVYQFRADGRQRRMKLGSAHTMTPKQAEALYLEHAAVVAAGGDPLARKQMSRRTAKAARVAMANEPTVTELAEEYLQGLAARNRSERWQTEARRLVAQHITPTLGHRQVRSVTTAEVETLHEAMHDRPILANRIKAVLGAMFARAIRHERHPGPNPAAAVDDYPETPRTRTVQKREWPRLAEALNAIRREAEAEGSWNTFRAQLDCLTLLMLTGARRDALRTCRWRDVDFAEAKIRLDPPHKRVHEIALGRAAVAFLRLLRHLRHAADDSAPIFPGQRPGRRRSRATTRPVSSVAPAWSAVRERAKLADVTIHDLRRSFATVAGELGFSQLTIDGLLGHAVQGIGRVYIQKVDTALRAAADAVSVEIRERLRTRPVVPRSFRDRNTWRTIHDGS